VPRAGLTPSAVVAQAAELADAGGFDQLTLAAVASSLGVALPSLYKHVRGLPDLRRQIAVLGAREMNDAISRAAVGRSGGDALLAVGQAYRDYALRYPGRYAATLRVPDAASDVDGDYAAAAADALTVVSAVLLGYGIEGQEAADATRMIRAVLHGFVSLETAGGFGMPRDVGQSFARAMAALDVTLRSWHEPAASLTPAGPATPEAPQVRAGVPT
jgi:AcrR family transcriptional regulator